MRRSKRIPSASEVSNARLTVSFAGHHRRQRHRRDGFGDLEASSSSVAAGTTRATRPDAFGLGRIHHAAGEDISIALALPTARVSRCVPPIPGMMPSLISGWPNLALSAAMMKSHCMASSQPPPSAKPATAAIDRLARPRDAMPGGAEIVEDTRP